jgi:hypothetical protein
VQEKKWLIGLIVDQVQTKACWFVVLNVIFLEIHHRAPGTVIEQFIVIESQNLRSRKISKDVLRELVKHSPGISKTSQARNQVKACGDLDLIKLKLV